MIETGRRGRVAAILAAGFLLALPAPAPAADGAAEAAKKPRVKTVTLLIGHRVFPDFRDRVTVRPGELFRVGDTEYTAKVTEFQPDFTMGTRTRKVSSRSNEPRNPAVRVLVWKDGAPADTSWAFLNLPPHFQRKSMLAFMLTRIEFENRPPVEARRDSVPGRTSSATR